MARAVPLLPLCGILLCACSGRADDDPEEVVQQLIGAARAGDRAAVYQRLGPATRARIDAVIAGARTAIGRLTLKPQDFLSVGWAPPSWEPVGMRVVGKDDAHAEVEVNSLSGDRHSVMLVREGATWKVELPAR